MAGPAPGADDAVARAMALYQRHHYEEAARTLQAGLPVLNPATRATAYLTLGMIYLDNARLHRELHEAGIAAQLDYLKRLAAVRGTGGSRFASLYLGSMLLESGNSGEATRYLERFSAQPGVEPRYRAIAEANLGLCHFLRKDAQKARALWAAIDTADPEIQLALAAVYIRAGLQERDPVAMGDAALKKVGYSPSSRMLENLLTVYVRAGLTDKSLELVKQVDLKAASYTEVLGQTKTINFYDMAALGDLATLYRQASVLYLEKAAAEAQLKPTADYYLGAAHADAGNVERSLQATGAIEAGEGKKTRPLNIALGQHYLWRRDYDRAVAYLEAGRDKSNKNRIEANDPVMLVNLAEAYYRRRQFSEGLEIYFEMSKHFPVVRRIHEATQSIYSMEHKSAGDVRIF